MASATTAPEPTIFPPQGDAATPPTEPAFAFDESVLTQTKSEMDQTDLNQMFEHFLSLNKEIHCTAISAASTATLDFSIFLYRSTTDELYRTLENWKESGIEGPVSVFWIGTLNWLIPRQGPAGASFLLMNGPRMGNYIAQNYKLFFMVKKQNNDIQMPPVLSKYARDDFHSEGSPRLLQELVLENNLLGLQVARKYIRSLEWNAMVSLRYSMFALRSFIVGLNLLSLAFAAKNLELVRWLLSSTKHDKDLQAMESPRSLDPLPFYLEALESVYPFVSPHELVFALVALLNRKNQQCVESVLQFIRDHFDTKGKDGTPLRKVIWDAVINYRFESIADTDAFDGMMRMFPDEQLDKTMCPSILNVDDEHSNADRYRTRSYFIMRWFPLFQATVGEMGFMVHSMLACLFVDKPMMSLLIKHFPKCVYGCLLDTKKSTLHSVIMTVRRELPDQDAAEVERRRLECTELLLKHAPYLVNKPGVTFPTPFEMVYAEKNWALVEKMLPCEPTFTRMTMQSHPNFHVDKHSEGVVELLLTKYQHHLTCMNLPTEPGTLRDSNILLRQAMYSFNYFISILQQDTKWINQHVAVKAFLNRKGLALAPAARNMFKARMNELPAAHLSQFSHDIMLFTNNLFVSLDWQQRWDAILTESAAFLNGPEFAASLDLTKFSAWALLCCYRMKNWKGCRKHANMLEFGPPDIGHPELFDIWKSYHDSHNAAASESRAREKLKRASAPHSPSSNQLPASPASVRSTKNKKKKQRALRKASSSDASEMEDMQAKAAAKEGALLNQPFNGPQSDHPFAQLFEQAAATSTSGFSSLSSSSSSSLGSSASSIEMLSPSAGPEAGEGQPRAPKSSAPAQQQPHPNECKICMERPWDHVLVPCGHPYCANCAKTMKDSVCALCRQPVVSYVRVYC